MKISTKIISTLALSLFIAGSMQAQWCVPTTVTPYNNNMPGISNVTFSTINHNSATLESPTNNYINTGISTTVARGSTYTFKMTFNTDPSIDTHMNLRVWIDYNIDGQLDDPGETVITSNTQNPGTYTGSITIPASATLGTTRMRVTSKMTSAGGHTLPTPCDMPADPLGYHGGMEDYTVVISTSSGVENVNNFFSNAELMPNPSNGNSSLVFTTADASTINATVYSITGEQIIVLAKSEDMPAGSHKLDIQQGTLTSGIYFVVLQSGNSTVTRKLVVL